MNADTFTFDDELEAYLIEADDVIEGFRDRYGEHRLGSFEDDPQMCEYEDRLDLAHALR